MKKEFKSESEPEEDEDPEPEESPADSDDQDLFEGKYGVQTKGRESLAKPGRKIKEEPEDKPQVPKVPVFMDKIDRKLSKVLPASNSLLLD